MNLEDFYKKFASKKGGITPSGQAFIDKIFYPMYGEYGLDFIEPEEDFYTSDNEYRIDFIVRTPYKHYLIEVDGTSHHAGRKRYAESEDKKNDINLLTNQF